MNIQKLLPKDEKEIKNLYCRYKDTKGYLILTDKKRVLFVVEHSKDNAELLFVSDYSDIKNVNTLIGGYFSTIVICTVGDEFEFSSIDISRIKKIAELIKNNQDISPESLKELLLHQIAVSFSGRRLTHSGINRSSNALARTKPAFPHPSAGIFYVAQ